MTHSKQEKMTIELEDLGEKLDGKLYCGLIGISFMLLAIFVITTFIIVYETINMMTLY